MASYAELLCNFISEVKLNHEDDIADQEVNDSSRMLPAGMAAGKTGQIDLARSIDIGMYQIIKFLRDDPNWQTKQARRKFEKEDILNKNPSFDPIFMKV